VNDPCERGLLQFLQRIPDSRGRQGRRHPQTAMLAAFVCAQLCGFHGFDAVAAWARTIPLSFWHALGGRRWPPCANAFNNLMKVVDPADLERALWQWITEGLCLELADGDLEATLVDGKVLRGTRKRHARAALVIAALDRTTGCVLSQAPVDPDTNEAAASIAFLKALVLENRVRVLDAAYCQRNVCETITEGGGDHLIVVKDNQPQLHDDARRATTVQPSLSPLGASQGRPRDAAPPHRREGSRSRGTA
jgi:hypothetical protein